MTSPIDPVLQQKITIWRQRAATNDLTLEECQEAVKLLREGRMQAAAAAQSTKRAAAKKAIPTAEQLFGGLEDL